MNESKIPKFRRCVIQNFPFIEEDFDALTDYGLLCKVVEYLNVVIDHQNGVDEKIDGLVEGFAELKSYVDNYFANLDVQEEINNKLEDMAEGGELATIIAQFLELAPVFGYATISAMAAAENLADGCIARVLGNSAATNGDGAFYSIRTKTGADDPDGVNLVAIGDSLVGVRIPDAGLNKKLNHYQIAAGASADDVQAVIDLAGDKIIEFAKGQTFTFTKALHLTSGTTLQLNGATLYFNFIDSTDETLGIYNYKFDDTFTGYNGAQNVVIKNGYIKQGCVVLMHGNNTTLENVEFIDMYCRHCIQIAGCKDTTIKKCVFNGVYKDDTIAEGSECINIDPTTYGAQPYMPDTSVMYDNTVNKGIYVDECTFKQAADEYHQFYIAFGAHYSYNDYHVYNFGVQIKNCTFETPNYWAICLRSMQDVLIDNNNLYGDSTYSRDDGTYFVIARAANNNVIVSNNVITGIEQIYHSGAPVALSNNLTIANNTCETQDNDGFNPAIWLVAVNNTRIIGNSILSDGCSIVSDGYPEGSIVSNGLTINNNVLNVNDDQKVLVIKNSTNIVIDGNSISNEEDSFSQLIQFATVTNINSVRNNKISNTQKFVTSIDVVNKNFANNGAMYRQMEWQDVGATSVNGDFAKNITNFRSLILQLGDSTNGSQVVTLKPWYWNGNFMDDRVYKFTVAKTDNTFGYGTLTISDSGASYSYSGSIVLRCMWASDTAN